MQELKIPLVSVVVPVYNESEGLSDFHTSLIQVLAGIKDTRFEIIYCDDGSSDQTEVVVRQIHDHDKRVKLICLSRNFGKENALTAGIAVAQGQAVMTLDGDGQHPVSLIPKFISEWQAGNQVVIGVGTGGQGRGLLRNIRSKAFYSLFNLLTGQKLLTGSTDFRLIDRSVQQAFLRLPENDRITRGLIDWLGFRRSYIKFKVLPRLSGSSVYSRKKLVNLAINSFVSLTPRPLYLFGYIGVLITIGSLILGLLVLIEQLLLNDPWHWRFTGTAMLSILLLFLVGIVLMSQGVVALYIAHTHNQSKGRPLYVVDYSSSLGIGNEPDA